MQFPSLKFLRTFHVAARLGSFKAAADELCITASAVSHQMKELEAHLGVALFERGPRSLRLTEAGSQYRGCIESVFASLETAAEQLRARFGRAALRLSAPPFFASELLVPQLASFSAVHPDVDIRITTPSASHQAHSAGTDISVIVGSGPWPQLSAARLFAQIFVPACAPGLLNELKARADPFWGGHALLVHSNRPNLWDQWAATHGIGALGRMQRIHLDSMSAVVHAAENSVGIALVSAPVAAARFAAGTLARLCDQEITTGEAYYVLSRPEDAPRQPVRALVSWLLQQFGTAPPVAS
jgi:LysR family glycine cleavage system transcriptional activator